MLIFPSIFINNSCLIIKMSTSVKIMPQKFLVFKKITNFVAPK